MTASDEPVLDSYIATRFLYLVHRAETASTEAIAGALSDLELSGTHSLVLEVLNAHPHISAAQVARFCGVSRQALLVPLGYLESRGLVLKESSAPRARVKPLALTAEGRRLADLVRERVMTLESRAMAVLSEGERELLRELLAKYGRSWEAQRATDVAAN